MSKLAVIENNGILVTDSREVAIMIDKEHDQLMRSIRTYVKYLESAKMQSENFFIKSNYINQRNQQQPCYLLTKKGCDMVANKMTGEKGVLFTAAYVTKFEEMEKELNKIKTPTNYLEALKALVCSEEEKAKLETENTMKQKLIEAKDEAIIEMKPKVEFTNRLLGSKDSLLVRQYCKVLQKEGFKLGQMKLFEWLRNKGYLMKNNEPFQRYLKYFEVIERSITVRGKTRLTYTPKITTEGQLYFFKKLNQSIENNEIDGVKMVNYDCSCLEDVDDEFDNIDNDDSEKEKMLEMLINLGML